MSVIERLFRLQFLATLWQAASLQCISLWTRIPRFFYWLSRQPLEKLKEAQKIKHLRRPKVITYHPIPGPWQRNQYPNWPKERFEIPEDVPYGTIYYFTKGTFVAMGMTAHIERLPEGHVVKFPKTNPYDPTEEETNFLSLRREAEVYRRLRDCPYIPKLIHWDSESHCLHLEYFSNGNLAYYIRGYHSPDWQDNPPDIDPSIRRRWTIQATKALQALHAVHVIHSDFVPRNLLLDTGLNLYMSDFASSSVDGTPYMVDCGVRFRPPFWTFNKTPEISDDLFSLGSVLYTIMASKEPYADIDELEVAELYRKKEFPDVLSIVCGSAIEGCWNGTLTTTGQVLDILAELYVDADI